MTELQNGTDKKAKPVWFFIGFSTGFGRILSKSTLERGYSVAVTGRQPKSVEDLAGLGDALILKLDVIDQS